MRQGRFDSPYAWADYARMRTNRVQNQLRIIGGRWRGRRLPFVSLPGLRPTPDRVRETLFNWLSPVIHGSRCLDLFAGSGALGLEAASRGADRVILVEHAPEAAARLREQLVVLNAAQVEVVQADAMQWLQKPLQCPDRSTDQPRPATFDIVFLDPPFQQRLLPDCLRLLETGGWLAPDALIYLEMEQGQAFQLPGHWHVYRSKRAGQVEYRLIKLKQRT